MHATLVGVLRPVADGLEERLGGVRVRRVAGVEALSGPLPRGLVVLGDAEGPLEELLQQCQRVHARRVSARTWLVVLTERGPAEREALVRAGADECMAPPGDVWGERLLALERRLAQEDAQERFQLLGGSEHASDFLHKVLDAIPEPVFVKDRDHRWVAANGAFCRFMGHGAEALLGRSDYEFVPAHEADVFWRQDELAFASGEPNENEEAHTGEGGRTRTLVTKKAVFTAGDQRFLVAIIRDVTERKHLELQLRLADRMASVGTLAAGVAHEINNPLAFVCSNLSFLGTQLGQEALTSETLGELREVVAETHQGLERVRTIVQDLKVFSRAEGGAQSLVDVHQVVEGALRLVRYELQHRARVERELEPVPAVLGQEGRLGQVLVNLLMNALQSFPEPRPEHNRIRVVARRQGADKVVVAVEDNGPGMSAEVLPRIFDPFFTTKPVGVGTGLGLSISHSLVKAMGGHLEVRSAPGEGSVFQVVLPVVACEEQEVQAARRAEDEARMSP